jgi:Rad3-related DNA helicase
MAHTYRLEEVFSRDGTLSRVLSPAFEWRPQQGEMAEAVSRVLHQGGHLLVEAPTGVGKSLAYLVPGILWALETRQPFVVSTYTRSLQDQILDKDVPAIRRLLDREFKVAVLKGRANYLCRNRWIHYLDEVRGTVEGEELERALGYWTQTTETGDFSENPIPAGKGSARVTAATARICSESRFCSGPSCRAESGCFFKLSRARARDAHLVVVNHSLLLIDLLADGAGLPEWNAVVIDEGHHLPRIAAEPLSFSVSENSLESALKQLGGRGEPGLTDHLRRVLRGHGSKVDRAQVLTALRDLETETARLSLLVRGFWSELKSRPSFPRSEDRLRYGPTAPVQETFPAGGLSVCTQWSDHLERIKVRIDEVRGLRRSAPEAELFPLLEAEHQWSEVALELHHLEDLLTPDKPGFIYWIEPATASGATLRAAPLEVGPQLREALFTRPSVILTSATLAVSGTFDHLGGKLGLGEDEYEGLVLSTPFRLPKQVSAAVVTGVPDPNEPDFPDALAKGIELLACRLRRKMLVLFTSHDALRRVEASLRAPLQERGVRLLAQGLDGGQRQVRIGFQEDGPVVLLGTAAFWEGVDFPGEELEVLVMARLPFLVPTDPLVQATSEKLESEGLNPFVAFHLPEALIRFRQGFGRLIRRRDDKGLFVLVDPRMESRSYGNQFKRSVGVPFRVATGWDELAVLAEEWFAASGD